MTKLCPRGKAAAKRKFKVYPSAYANAYASKICAGKIKDPSGTKRKDWGPKKAKKGKMMIMIAIGKPKKANTGEFIERPIPRKRKKMGIYTKPDYEYMKKKKAYDILTNEDRRPPRSKTLRRSKGGDIIKKVASKLEKASKAHAGQAKTLRSIKVRGGGMAVQGMNFKGVY